MGPEQIAALLKHIPDILNRVSSILLRTFPSIPDHNQGYIPTVALICIGNAPHVIEGIGHVRRDQCLPYHVLGHEWV